jgi:hypothetical protein
MTKKRVHYAHPACKVVYDWNGRRTFWGARAGSVVARATRLEQDPRATNITVVIGDRSYQPRDVDITR